MSLSNLFTALAGTAPVPVENPKPALVTPIDHRVEYQGVKLSLRAWSKHTGISEPTLRYRHKRGWSPPQILGYAAPPVRDRAVEQLDKHEAKVIIYGTNNQIITRREAAALLKIQLQSLRRRLKQYRAVGKVTLEELKQSSRRL